MVRQRQRAGTRCYRTRTRWRGPAALQQRQLMAPGKGASSLSNYTRVCAGVNKRVCTGITVMSRALMRILWTRNARLSEYFSRCQRFESRVTRVQMKMLSHFGKLPAASAALPLRPHGSTYSSLGFFANSIEKTAGRSTSCCNAILLDYLSCSLNTLTGSTDLQSIIKDLHVICALSGLKPRSHI